MAIPICLRASGEAGEHRRRYLSLFVTRGVGRVLVAGPLCGTVGRVGLVAKWLLTSPKGTQRPDWADASSGSASRDRWTVVGASATDTGTCGGDAGSWYNSRMVSVGRSGW